MINRNYSHLFKLVLVGDSGVGKSCLLLRYADDAFTESFISTIGVDFRFKSIKIDGITVKLQIWDTAGQERFRTITAAYYKGADSIIFVYDITHKESFNNISYWISEAVKYQNPNIPIMIVGNKADRSDRMVTYESLEKLAKTHNALYMECSARSSINITEMFETLSKKLIAQKIIGPPEAEPLYITPHTPNKNKCC